MKRTGVALLLAGVILNVLMFVSGAYPTYLFFMLMGLGLVFWFAGVVTDKMSKLYQTIILLMPVLGCFIWYLIESPSRDTFLIPANFRGIVYVYYNQPNGSKGEYKNGRRIYRVPPDGILLTSLSLKGDVVDISGTQYYLVDSTGRNYELGHCDVHDLKKDTLHLQVIDGVCGQHGLYGVYQTFCIDTPNASFFSNERTSHEEALHDSLMKFKTGLPSIN